jgi:hypothetical protein
MYFADMVMADRRDISDPRFDRWLSRRLHEAYDGVLKEQLPAELDHLVQQLGARRSGGSGPSADGGLEADEEKPTDGGRAALHRWAGSATYRG